MLLYQTLMGLDIVYLCLASRRISNLNSPFCSSNAAVLQQTDLLLLCYFLKYLLFFNVIFKQFTLFWNFCYNIYILFLNSVFYSYIGTPGLGVSKLMIEYYELHQISIQSLLLYRNTKHKIDQKKKNQYLKSAVLLYFSE